MNEKSLSGARPVFSAVTSNRQSDTRDRSLDLRLDLVVLQSMAKKLMVTLRTSEQSTATALPLSYSFKEQRGREHRVIIYAPCELCASNELRFVGFVSQRSLAADQQVIDEIFCADQMMLTEIAHVPGLLSYSSLELRSGHWYNLVVLRDSGVKLHIRDTETHRNAAHHLSPAYYEWIRLHNGTMPGGLTCLEMHLKSTKYYFFPGGQQPPAVREITYEECTGA